MKKMLMSGGNPFVRSLFFIFHFSFFILHSSFFIYIDTP